MEAVLDDSLHRIEAAAAISGDDASLVELIVGHNRYIANYIQERGCTLRDEIDMASTQTVPNVFDPDMAEVFNSGMHNIAIGLQIIRLLRQMTPQSVDQATVQVTTGTAATSPQ